MKTEMMDAQLETCVEQLLAVLDNDIAYVEANIARLNDLRSLVIKQDVDAMNRLLANIRTESTSHENNEFKRQTLRKKLAAMCGCPLEEITLTRIETLLPYSKNSGITQRKTKLQALTGTLKREFISTQTLLADCARFNRMLLKSIFEIGQTENLTYKKTGAAYRQADTVFMNVQF